MVGVKHSSPSLLTVVIPTINEKRNLGILLPALLEEDGVEIVVADGGSVDGTVETARSLGAVVVQGRRGRAEQMNDGGTEARGEAILFLHADCRLPKGFSASIRQSLADGGNAGGVFTFALDGDGVFFRFITMTTAFRSKWLGVHFGDQGLFVRAGIFRESGGFPDIPIMEDFEFVRTIRRYGKVALLAERIVTSGRRWRSSGMWKNTALNVLITWAHIAGVSPERLSKIHRRHTRREAPPVAAGPPS